MRLFILFLLSLIVQLSSASAQNSRSSGKLYLGPGGETPCCGQSSGKLYNQGEKGRPPEPLNLKAMLDEGSGSSASSYNSYRNVYDLSGGTGSDSLDALSRKAQELGLENANSGAAERLARVRRFHQEMRQRQEAQRQKFEGYNNESRTQSGSGQYGASGNEPEKKINYISRKPKKGDKNVPPRLFLTDR
jgi:hypothetical protein